MIRFLALTALAASVALAADQPSPAELKMREALRNTMLQLRTTEIERANLQAANSELEQKLKYVDGKLQASAKQLADDKAAADKTVADLIDKVAKRDGDIVQLNDSLAKWKASHAQVSELARTKEAARAQFEAKSIGLERVVADQKRKNDAMYKLGTEVLNRYEHFGIGDALTAREPFVGITRVKFENLIQDYSDKLTDAKIKPAAPLVPMQSGKPVEKKPAASPAPAKSGKAKGARAVS
jgi:hypothetical protein